MRSLIITPITKEFNPLIKICTAECMFSTEVLDKKAWAAPDLSANRNLDLRFNVLKLPLY